MKTEITPYEAGHAADMIDGIIDHPFWGGIDRDALRKVSDALRNNSIQVIEVDDLPSWGIIGDKMIFLDANGYKNEREHASECFKQGDYYTIASTSIGRSSSTYRFEGIQGSWNTCMFNYADRDSVMRDWRENRSARIATLESYNEYMGYKIFGGE